MRRSWLSVIVGAVGRTGVGHLLLFFQLCSIAFTQSSSPIAQIANPVVPMTVPPGSAAFTLTVNGTGFVTGSTVYWNGSPRRTTFVRSGQLKAAILASDVANATSGSITVHNPGGSVSNTELLLVTNAVASPSFGALSIPQSAGYGLNEGLLAGDLNGDGNVDVVVRNNGVVQSAVGNGDGSFQFPINYFVPGEKESFGPVVADFNNDGKLDVLAGNFDAKAVEISLGTGDGTFQPAQQDFIGSSYNDAATGDFNGDGNLDMAYTAPSAVGILFGNGDGTFRPPIEFPLPNNPYAIAVGDFNRDGVLDIAASSFDPLRFSDPFVSILLGLGDGTFALHIDYPLPSLPSRMVVADVNGDGFPDVAVVDGPNTFGVLLNRGDGTLQPVVQFDGPNATAQFQDIAIGDFNGDAVLDLALYDNSSCSDGCVYVFAGNGDGTFQPGSMFKHRQGGGYVGRGSQLAVADFNHDGKLDIASPGGLGPFVMIQSEAPEPSIDPGSLSFAPQVVGTSSNGQGVSLLQPGNTVITINSVTAAGDFQLYGWSSGGTMSTFCHRPSACVPAL